MLNSKELTKTYSNGIQALKRISLEVPPRMFGLLGPNGAGKTTLMKILATLLEPDSGTAEMNGIDLIIDKHGTRKMLGYLPQEFGLYPTLTAEQTLHYFAKLTGAVAHNLFHDGRFARAQRLAEGQILRIRGKHCNRRRTPLPL